MRREPQLVKRQPSLKSSWMGVFGHVCGLDDTSVFSVLRHDYRVSCFCLDPIVVTDGLVCVQWEHIKMSCARPALSNARAWLTGLGSSRVSGYNVRLLQMDKLRPRGVK